MTKIPVLFQYMKENKITQNMLSENTGISQGNISDWNRGRAAPSMDNITKIADYFKVSTDYLLGKTDDPTPINDWLAKNAIPIGEMIRLPVYGRVSAGNGVLATNDIVGYEWADKKYADEEYFFLSVKGDSMSPKIEEGDLVLVRKQTSVDSGSYAVVTLDDEEGLIKKVVYGKDWIELHSVNPYYPIRRFDGKDVLKINVVGLVIESKRKFV